MIHETALVSKKAKMGKDVRIGPFAIIDDEVEIGDNCEIGPKVHLLNGTKIGNNNYILKRIKDYDYGIFEKI